MKRLLASTLALLFAGAAAEARPAHKKALAEHFGPFLARSLQDCRSCHLPEQSGAAPAEGERPHNPFGARLKALREELRRAGKATDLPARLDASAAEDSDGDGAANQLELLTGHNPGDRTDRPSAAELEAATRTRAEFLRFRSGYAWRPFAPVQRPAVPALPRTGWGRNPVDAFVAAEHDARGLQPRPEAPRHVLLRRVYLDLVGLPPTRAELQAFLADPDADAYEKVVDRLLASPQYGERWGRHWMDVWRYSDWAGYGMEVRDSQRHIWRWRDWIVESLNADKGYDRMVQEMLAGDELAPDDPATLRATGFLVRNWYKFNRNVWLQNTVEHTAKAFLGVTLNCARCHDHFFDPITQPEYFAFRAFFEPHDVRTDRVPGQPDLTKDGLPRVFDANPAAPTYLFVRGDEHRPDKSQTLAPSLPAALGGPPLRIEPVSLSLTARHPEKRDFFVRETVAASANKVAEAQAALARARQNLALAAGQLAGPSGLMLRVTELPAVRQVADALALAERNVPVAELSHAALEAVLVAERLEDAGRTHSAEWQEAARRAAALQRQQALATAQRDLLVARQAAATASARTRAAATARLNEVEKTLAAAEAGLKTAGGTAYTKRTLAASPATSTGRRLALARWLTDRQNPLAARVAMNHIWLRHFGRPLVATVFEFGGNGQPPTHPALLDWLAAEFMERHWSMKAMHRLLVTSSAYRMDSTGDAVAARLDPDNRYLWRMNPRRMEAELVRDSVLHVAGRLDPAQGGPDLDHTQGLAVLRRSLYFRHAHEKQMEFLALFDAANVTECYQRAESIVPQQALALANSPLVLAQSRLLARRLVQEVGSAAPPFVRAAFEQVLSRPPTPAELAECERFLSQQAALLAAREKLTAYGGPAGAVPPAPEPDQRAREDLVHVLLNHHEFVTIR